MNKGTAGRLGNDPSLVQSVDRALQILTAYETEGHELSILQLSQKVHLPKSTVHRLLATLANRGFIEQNSATGNYRLGLKLHALGSRVVLTRNLTTEAGPIVRQLVERFGETVSISVLDGIETVIVEKMESEQAMRVTSQIGKRNPIHCSGSGKMLLALQSPEEIERILALAPLDRYTDKTITDPGQLKANLAEIRRNGYAVDDEEIQLDQVCISAPIRDYRGAAFAAVTISGPATRIRSKGVEVVAATIQKAANEISERLGWNDELEPAVGGPARPER